MTRVQRMSMSNMDGEIPAPGESIQLLADEDLAEALQEALVEHGDVSVDTTDTVDEDLVDIDDDLEINMHADANRFASALGVSPTGKSKSSSSPAGMQFEPPQADRELDLLATDSMNAEDDSEKQVEEDISAPRNTKAYLIGGAIISIIIIVAAIVSSLAGKFGSDQQKTEAVTESQAVRTASRYGNDQLDPTDSGTYQDSMTIDKYIEIDKDSCVFVFTGYAENARAFVKAYVDIDTYNLYKVGARVPILYEHITIGGKDYYMKVRVNN